MMTAPALRSFVTSGASDGTVLPTSASEPAVVSMADLGDAGDTYTWFDDEFTVLLCEFKDDIASYLSGLGHTRMRTLSDLIDFNIANCPQEMRYFGQEVFEISQATGGTADPAYAAARANSLHLAKDVYLDPLLEDLDAIITPSYAFGSSAPCVAGYPSISIPVGLTADGKPAGIWMYAGFLDDAKLISYAYDIEQELRPRTHPTFAGQLPPRPDDAGICDTLGASAFAKPHQRGALRKYSHLRRVSM